MLRETTGLDTASVPPLTEQLAALGATRRAGGGTPFLLDDPSRAAFIVAGRIDLFLVEVVDGRPSGSRTHIASFEAGSLLFGIDGTGLLGTVGLLAVAVVGTSVIDITIERLRHLAVDEPTLLNDLSHLVEGWVCALSDAAASAAPAPPSVRRPIAAGEPSAVGADERVTSAASVGWLALDGRRALLLDSADVEDGTLMPVTPRTWATIGEGGEVQGYDTWAILLDGRIWPALDAFHIALVDLLPFLLRLAAADEVNRLKRRAIDEARALDAAEASLAAAVVAPRGRPPMRGDANDALLVAVRAIAEVMRLSLVLPNQTEDDGALTLDAILRGSNLRKRQVVLDGNWWRDDVGPLLLPDGPDGHATAILQRGRRKVIVARDGSVRRLGRREAARLAGPAFVIYEPFPDHPLTSVHMLQRVWQAGGAEIRAMVGFSTLAGMLSLVFPVITGWVANDVVPSRDTAGLIEVAIILTVVAGLQFALRLGAGRAVLRLDGSVGTRLQAALMDRVLRLPAGFFQGVSAGEISQRILILKASVDGLTGGILGALVGGSVFLSSLAIMAYASSQLVIPGLLLILLLAGVSGVLGAGRHRYEKDLVRDRGLLSGRVLELMNGVVKLRLAAAENRAFALWASLYSRFARNADAAKRVELSVGIALGSLVIGAQAVLFLLVYQSGAVEAGFGLGQIVTFLAAFNQAIGGASIFMGSALTLHALKSTLNHASPILAGRPEPSTGALDPGPLSGAIEIGGVHFSYGPNGPPVLSELTIQIEPGELVALVGPSGGGKSTIVRLLLGFETPNRGAILYDSKDLRSLDVGAVRRQMGVVLQRGRLFGASLEENILGANVDLGPDAAWQAAEEAGLAADIRAMPMGMQTVYVEGGLSGGQVQRVLLARALVHRPRILILDEATSALDNRTQALVTDTLSRLSATRLVIAHRLSTVMSADRILVIQNGSVAESGSYAELLAAGGAFSEIAARQLT